MKRVRHFNLAQARSSTVLRTVLTAIVAAVLLLTPALAQKTDVVILRNGDRITGEVKNLTLGRLEFKTDSARTIFIEWDYVVSVTSSLFFEVLTENGHRSYGACSSRTRQAR